MIEDKEISHPAFGIVEIGKVNVGGSYRLFASSIKHRSFVSLRIFRATTKRNIYKFWNHHKGAPIIEINLSNSQFTDLITSLNSTPVPCTISYVDGERTPPIPEFNNRETVLKEFQDHISKIKSMKKEASDKLNTLNISKKAKEEIMMIINGYEQQVNSNLPFILESFNESMDTITTECKSDISSYIENILTKVATNELTDKSDKLTSKLLPLKENL